MLHEMRMKSILNVLPLSFVMVAMSAAGFLFCKVDDDIVGQYVMWGVLGLLGAMGVFFVIRAVAGGYQTRVIKKLKDEGGTALQAAEEDYRRAREVCAGVKAGRTWLFCMRGAFSQIFRLDQIAWAYVHMTEKRRNGFAISKTYRVRVHMLNRTEEEIECKDENMCQVILKYLNDTLAGVFIGYSKELMQLYQSGNDDFMRLRREKEARSGESQAAEEA